MMCVILLFTLCFVFFFYCYGDTRDLHVLTHSFPTRRSSDLPAAVHVALPADAAVDPSLLVVPGEAVADFDMAEAETLVQVSQARLPVADAEQDRKSTRLNSSH